MPIPSYPENRREEYLNNIATGSGEIPPYPENREEQYLDAIARNGGGGSSSLPEVTSDDNGDVLTVVEGAWAKAAPSGGGGVLVVHMDDDTGALDKTWQEIADAGFAVLTFNGEASILCATCVEIASSGYGVDFYLPPHTGGPGELLPFAATSADGYPVYSGD